MSYNMFIDNLVSSLKTEEDYILMIRVRGSRNAKY